VEERGGQTVGSGRESVVPTAEEESTRVVAMHDDPRETSTAVIFKGIFWGSRLLHLYRKKRVSA